MKFSVKDTGIGIPTEKIDRLFKPFSQVDPSTTRKFGGTGLGLAICYKLVRLMNGKIWVESKSGQGSDFVFTIKTNYPTCEGINAIHHPSLVFLKGKKALLADCNPLGSQITKSVFSEMGMNTLMAISASDTFAGYSM